MPLRSFLMKLQKKQTPKSSFDDCKVTIDTKEELSEEQREVIISTVREGMKDGDEFRDIAIWITVYLECRVSVSLVEVDDGVKVRIF